MRHARTNDIWRALFSRNDLPIRKIKVVFDDVTEIGSQTIEIQSPISLICGENGVGKSSLLWVLYRALASNVPVNGMHRTAPPKLASGKIQKVEVSIASENDVKVFSNVLDAYNALDTLKRSPEPPVIFIDPTFQIPELVRAIRSDNNFSDLLEGVEAAEFQGNELALISNLVGKGYQRVKVYEIENYAGYEVFPYFRVAVGGRDYGSEEMGLGELSLLKMYWALSSINRPSIVLIEEPETFIAPRSQRALVDLIAKFCNEKKLLSVISTHSGIIAERVPNSHLSLITKGTPNVIISSNPAANLLVERLGLFTHKNAVLLVEDVGAKALLQSLLEENNSRLASGCEIAIAGSESHITFALKSMPKDNPVRFRLVGVYDGDAKNIKAVTDADVIWPKLFLPGDECPEILIYRHVNDLGYEAVAQELGKAVVDVATAFGGADGKNHHDWLNEVCASLKISITEFFQRLAASWGERNKEEAQKLITQIKAAIV